MDDVANWQPIPAHERRVLGVLIEKQKTSKSPDAYPMSLNAITTGCNQKSNRDPVMDLDEDAVEETLAALQKKLLVMKMTGSRVDRYRHMLYENWKATKVEMAVLGELLLRGPQTKGDLRGRAARMEPIDTMDALEDHLRPLVERRLVVYLTAPDRRGAALTHGFHTPDELARARTQFANAPAAADEVFASAPARAAAPPPEVVARLEARLSEALSDIERLKAAVATLEGHIGELRKQSGVG